MKRIILALAISGIAFAAVASPPPGGTGGPPVPFDVNVTNNPLPVLLQRPSSMPGLAATPANWVSVACGFGSDTTSNSKSCSEPWLAGRIWSTLVRMTNDSDNYNCAVEVSISNLGIPAFYLGGFTAMPGSSAAFLAYPILIDHPAEPKYSLTIDIRRRDTTKGCSAGAVVQFVPES